MAKDPAFLFYPGDYLRDTQNFTEHQQVAYDRIMCEHMRNICITQTQLNFFTKRLNPEEKNELLFYLKQVEGGFQIEWVAESIEKRRSYSENRRDNRTKNKKDICLSHDEHMENEIENENINKNSKNNEAFVLPTWIPEETWKAYLEVRNKKKAAKTTYALNLIIKKLEKIRLENKDYPVAVLNQSITGGWSDVYPLKKSEPQKQQPFIKQESPYEKCSRCGHEVRNGYEYINIGGQMCCEYCPESQKKAKEDYAKLAGMVKIKSL